MSHTELMCGVIGTITVEDEVDGVIRQVRNSIHPQNFARLIARALSGEANSSVFRVAFGNGGTRTDAAGTVTFKRSNTGALPDVRTWDSRIYNEIYSEIVDASSPLLGVDPGSADQNTGIRAGGGGVPSSDPTSIAHVTGPGVRSSELGVVSEAVITVVLNRQEPTPQYLVDVTGSDSEFVFDEIGLYTEGAPAISTGGYQSIELGGRTASSDTKLVAGSAYKFNISVDGTQSQTVRFVVPAGGGSGLNHEVLFGDLCDALNQGKTSWGMSGVSPLPLSATVAITDDTDGIFPSIAGAQTYGALRFQSNSVGSTSSVQLTGADTNLFLSMLNTPAGCSLGSAVVGKSSGVQNNPTSKTAERERLITHAIFTPVTKVAGRQLTIRYVLSISTMNG